MLDSPEKTLIGSSTVIGIIEYLSDENKFNTLSYERYLHLAAKNEEIALSLVSDSTVQSVMDGLAISILGSKHGLVAEKILSISVLRDKLYGIDLEKLAASSIGAAIEVLTAVDLKSRLKTYDIAAIGAARPELVDKIIADPSLMGRIEYIHYGKLCENNIDAAQKLISEKSSYMEGVEIALIAKHHPMISLSVLENDALRHKIDTESLVILSTASEATAIAILKDSGFYEQLGPIGIARILANHVDLACSFIGNNPSILSEFDKISAACAVGKSSLIAMRLYQNATFRNRTKVESAHVAWIKDAIHLGSDIDLVEAKKPNASLLSTFEKVCISFMLKKQIAFPSNIQGGILQGVVYPMLIRIPRENREKIIHRLIAHVQRMEIEELVTLGNRSEEAANDILQNYKARLLGQDLVLLGENHATIAHQILNDAELSEKLSGLNLVMMCKNHPEECRFIFSNALLRERIVGCHAGVLALKDYKLLHLVFGDEQIKENLTQKDLPLLCKRYIGVTKQALAEVVLYSRFSIFYHELLHNRIETVGAISNCIQKVFLGASSDSLLRQDVIAEKSKSLLIKSVGQLSASMGKLSLQDIPHKDDKNSTKPCRYH